MKALIYVPSRKFSSWNKAARAGELEYYTRQHYTQGAKCWNGPHRSVEVNICMFSTFPTALIRPY